MRLNEKVQRIVKYSIERAENVCQNIVENIIINLIKNIYHKFIQMMYDDV